MHRHVWSRAASYLGIDIVYRWPDRRRRIIAPWSVALAHLELDAFNVFDLDAFGSPWPALATVVRRRRARPGERLAICVTDGTWRRVRFTEPSAPEWRPLRDLGVPPPNTLREMRPAAEATLARAARAMGARLDGLRVAGYRPSGENKAGMGYLVALLTGV